MLVSGTQQNGSVIYIYNFSNYFPLLCCLVTELPLTLCDPKDCSPPISSIYGISQARILEWVAISFSRVSSPGSKQHLHCLLHCRWILLGKPCSWDSRAQQEEEKHLFFPGKVSVKVIHSCQTLCDPMDFSMEFSRPKYWSR